MLKLIFGFGIIALAFQIALTSDSECGEFRSQENLNMEQMLGRWNVVRANRNDYKVPCLFFNLRKSEADKFSLDLCKDSNRFYCYKNFLNFTSSGEISPITRNRTDLMKGGNYYVRETDYDNYAVLHLQTCPQNYVSISILSRHYVFNEEEIDKLTEKYFDKNVSWMNSFTNCGKNGTNS